MATFLNDDFSVAWKSQSAFGTPATQGAKSTWNWIKVTFPQDSPSDEQEELQVSTGTVGAGDAIIPGRRAGTLSFTWNLTSQKSDYAGTPGNTALTDLIEQFFGSSASTGATVTNGLASSGTDATTWETNSGTYAPGNAYAVANDSGVVEAINWVESVSGTTLTMFQASREKDLADNSEIVQFLNFYPSATASSPFTLRITGTAAAEDMRYLNCYPTSLKLTLTAAKGIQATMTCSYYGRHLAADGGLYAGTDPFGDGSDNLVVPPLAGQHHARVMIAANKLTSLLDDASTEVPEGLCGLDELEVNFESEIETSPCHGATDGVSAAQLTNKVMKVTCFVPFDNSKLTATVTETATSPDYNNLQINLESWYEAQDAISFSCEVGKKAGQLFCVRAPRMYIDTRPQPATVGKRVGYRLTLRSAPYSGDGSSTGAGNKPYTISFG